MRWLIQIPRMYYVYKEDTRYKDFTFQTFIESTHAPRSTLSAVCVCARCLTLRASPDIFRPLFEVSVNPAKHPNLHHFLKQVVGIDCVDDESKPEKRLPRYPPPKEWNTAHNPPYSYYLYYLYVANVPRSQHAHRGPSHSVIAHPQSH